MQDKQYVKILFRFHSEVFEKETVETVWAITIHEQKGHYQIDNIPFYIPMIACGDIVFAAFDEQEERLTYRHTIEESGNSTIQIVLLNGPENEGFLRDKFKEMGCESEGTNTGYFVMEVPSHLDYGPVKLQLIELFEEGVLDYAEVCLSQKHQ